MNYTEFNFDANGDLVISISKEGLDYLAEIETGNDEQDFLRLIEDHLCNGYSIVQPEHIGALTAALIIASGYIDAETTQEEVDNTEVWWFPDYQVLSYTEQLKKNRAIVFTKAE